MSEEVFEIPQELFPESGLSYRLTTRWDDDACSRVLILSFSGEYRTGSAGTPDAQFMVAILGAAVARFEPDAVVFDFEALDYSWGNSLLGIFECLGRWDAGDPVRCAIAAGPRCRDALVSLLTPTGESPPKLLQHDLESAVAAAAELAAARVRDMESSD